MKSLSNRKSSREVECDIINKSTICMVEGTKGNIIVPSWWWCRMTWQSISIYLVVSWNIELHTLWITSLLSQYNRVGRWRNILIFASNQRNQTLLQVAEVMAWYSFSVEDLNTISCFLFFQEIRELPKKDTKVSGRPAIYRITSSINIIICSQL